MRSSITIFGFIIAAIALISCQTGTPPAQVELQDYEDSAYFDEHGFDEDEFYFPSLEPTFETDEKVFLFHFDVEGFRDIYLSYHGKYRLVERLDEWGSFGFIEPNEAFTYNLPNSTVSAYWLTFYHDAPTHYMYVTRENGLYKLFRAGFYEELDLSHVQLEPKLMGLWIRDDRHDAFLRFESRLVWDDSGFPRGYEFNDNVLRIYDNPDFVYTVLGLNKATMQLKDEFGYEYNYSRADE
jgi:hypothetical protein